MTAFDPDRGIGVLDAFESDLRSVERGIGVASVVGWRSTRTFSRAAGEIRSGFATPAGTGSPPGAQRASNPSE